MLVYKVVRNENGKLKSAMYHGGKAQLTYNCGRVIHPKLGMILAFDNLEAAQFFRGISKEFEVWLAWTPKAEPIAMLAYDGGARGSLLPRFREFWDLFPKFGARYMKGDTIFAPPHTVGCSELILLDPVEKESE